MVEGAVFCPKCGESTSAGMPLQKRNKHAWKWFVFPALSFFIVLMLWVIASMLASSFDAAGSTAYRVFKLIVPILIFGCVIMFPVGIVVGIVQLSQKK